LGHIAVQGWLKIKNAAVYADVSERLFRDWLKQGLRYVKVNGSIRTKPEWIDSFLMGFEANSDDQVDRIVEQVMGDL
jgi:hypothetical protein